MDLRSNRDAIGPRKSDQKEAVSVLRGWIWIQFLRQTWTNIKSSKIHYALGFFACFLVVVVVAVLMSLLTQTPVIFLRLSETSQSEIDLQIDAGTFTGYSRLNYTLAKTLLTDPDEQYSSARISKMSFWINPKKCQISKQFPQWRYKPYNVTQYCVKNCPNINCPSSPSQNIQTVLLDIEREKQIMLGRNWKLNEKLKQGEIYINNKAASSLGVGVGDVIYGRWNASFGGRPIFASTLLRWQCPGCLSNSSEIDRAEVIWSPFVVKDIFSDVQGKFSRSTGERELILVDYESSFTHISKHLNDEIFSIGSETTRNFTSFSGFDFATTMILNLPNPRIDLYLTSKYDIIHNNLIHWSNKALYKIGFAQVYVDLPVLRGLSGTSTVSLFLGLILNVIIFILLFLSIVLIYSLLMISVETRTFEMGILRMIGLTRIGMICLLLVQAFSYAIPAWIIGIISAMGIYYGAAAAVTSITNASISHLISGSAFGYATLVGLLVPVLASILPIRAALGQNLQDSLDVKHNKTKAVEINIERSEEAGFSSKYMTQMLIGGALSIFGAMIYYILPQGLLGANLSLLMNMFFFILIGMLFGLVLIALNLQHLMERFLAFVFFFWESKAIRALVVKNLVAHRIRNQKTSILYALSLGFIIFINIAYQIQVQTISENQKQRAGAFMIVRSNELVDPTSGIISGIYNKEAFERVKTVWPNYIEDYTWVTTNLRSSYLNGVNSYATNIGRWNFDLQQIHAVSPNFFRSTFDEYLNVHSRHISTGMDKSEYKQNKKMDLRYLTDELYTRDGSSRALMGSLYKPYLGLDPSKPFLIQVDQTSQANDLMTDSTTSSGGGFGMDSSTQSSTSAATSIVKIEYLAKPLAFMENGPFFRWSSFPLIKSQNLVVSIPTFYTLAGGDTSEIVLTKATPNPNNNQTNGLPLPIDLFDQQKSSQTSKSPWNSVEDIPMAAFLLKIKPNTPDKVLDQIHEWLDSRIAGPNTRVWDYRREMEPFFVANKAILYFFTFTTVIAMLISFFSLMSSMYTNIKEQTKEIGVIRALGIPKSWVYRIYIYEAFLLVISSSFLGMIIGTVTSYTMNSQQALFTQLPLTFDFPWLLLIVVVSCSILFSLLSSWSPIKAVLSRRIVQIFRGQ